MSDKKVLKLGDDLIAVVRELVQLSLLTGTNIVDHLRAIHVEVDDETKKLIPTNEYINSYNEMILNLQKQVDENLSQLEDVSELEEN